MFPLQIFQYFSVVYRCFNTVEETKLKYPSFRGCFLLCNKSYKSYGEHWTFKICNVIISCQQKYYEIKILTKAEVDPFVKNKIYLPHNICSGIHKKISTAASALVPLCLEQIIRILCTYRWYLLHFPLYFVARGDFGSCHSESQFDQMTTYIREVVSRPGPNEPVEIKQTTIINDNSAFAPLLRYWLFPSKLWLRLPPKSI